MCALRFVPREEKFYEYFGDQARILRESAALLVKGLAGGPAEMNVQAQAISKLEKRGDEINREVFDKLRRTFITPLDPEDIHTLASKLEDAIDGTEETARRIAAYQPKHTSPGLTKLCDLLLKATNELEAAIVALPTNGEISSHCHTVRVIEEESDCVAQEGLVELFTREKDPIEVIKAKDLIELLEDTIDLTDDVADILANVIVKNS